jgi:DNA-directed RNA polymerase specialized sigma subunit
MDNTFIGAYIKDINNTLKNASQEDILVLFRELYDKEQSFAKKLQSTAYGRKVYLSFIQKIFKTDGGIKAAKSFFRARQHSFLDTVNKGIRNVKPELIYSVPINFRFCQFAINELNGKDQKLTSLFSDIKKYREDIITKNLYLSLNRAKVYNSTSRGKNIGFDDLIQISNEALVVAVDKYVMDGEESTFYQMAIGRMISGLIVHGTNLSSATIGVHHQKKLYQIRKVLQDSPGISNQEVANILKVAREEIDELLSATLYKSMDDRISEDSKARYGDTIVSNSWQDDMNKLEKDDGISTMAYLFNQLTLLEKKVLLLKGVKLS